MSTTVLGVIAIIGMLLVGISLLLADIYQKVKELKGEMEALRTSLVSKFGYDFDRGFNLGLLLEYRKDEVAKTDGDYRIEC